MCQSQYSLEYRVVPNSFSGRIAIEGVYTAMSPHNIKVTLDYRVAHTVLQGMKQWLQKMEDLLDKAAAESGDNTPCRRVNGKDRRNGTERREHVPDEQY